MVPEIGDQKPDFCPVFLLPVFLEATDLLANAFQYSQVNGAVIEKEYYRWKTVELTIPISFDTSEQHKHKLK